MKAPRRGMSFLLHKRFFVFFFNNACGITFFEPAKQNRTTLVGLQRNNFFLSLRLHDSTDEA